MILYHAADLIWATRIKAAAAAAGIAARPVRTLEMLQARLGDCSGAIRGLIIDLESPEIGLALIGNLRGPDRPPEGPSIRILAFGPHVETDRLAAARTAGADTVLPRGAFAAGLTEWLARLDAAV